MQAEYHQAGLEVGKHHRASRAESTDSPPPVEARVPGRVSRFRKTFFILATTLGLFLIAVMASDLHLNAKSPTLPVVNGHLRSFQYTEEDVDELLPILEARIQNYSGPKLNWTDFKCPAHFVGSQTCYDPACPGQFSSSLKDRLQQVLSTRAVIPAQYLQALTSAARPVTSHKFIFVTGASSNHYNEMQALVHNVFHRLFPRMKGEDYTFVVYNLGLTPEERNLTEKNCRCTLIDFPFSELPDFVQHLKCYVWKPLIVASLLGKAEYLVWMDASIRWRPSTPLAAMFGKARASGYLTRHNSGAIAVRSHPSMARFFGDHLCQYAAFSEMETGLGIYYNDRFMRDAILHPWLSCAFNPDCMCVQNHTQRLRCSAQGNHSTRYGRCHRFEQSGIGMILSRLFLEGRPMLYVPRQAVSVKRSDKMNWFQSA